MMKRNKILICFVAFVIVIPIVAFFMLNTAESYFKELPYYGESLQEESIQDAHRIAPFQFTNQDHNKTSDQFTEGKVWVACYFFTSCTTICPKMISGMGEIQQRFKNEKNFKMISFTVDPDRDTPEILKKYASDRKIDTLQWNLGTGKKVDLYKYARKELKLVTSDGDGGPNDFIHSDRILLIDKQGYIRGYYDGTESSSVSQMAHDIEQLLNK